MQRFHSSSICGLLKIQHRRVRGRHCRHGRLSIYQFNQYISTTIETAGLTCVDPSVPVMHIPGCKSIHTLLVPLSLRLFLWDSFALVASCVHPLHSSMVLFSRAAPRSIQQSESISFMRDANPCNPSFSTAHSLSAVIFRHAGYFSVTIFSALVSQDSQISQCSGSANLVSP